MNSTSPERATASTRTPLQPFGLLVEGEGRGASIADVPFESLARLALEARVVVVRGFDLLDKGGLEAYCSRFGEVLRWDFGAVLDLVVHEDPQNYLFTPGDVPFHWDGAFASVSPRFFAFQCLRSNRDGGGETVFCDTTRVYAEATPAERARWRGLRVTYRTEKLAHYGGHVTHDLVSEHPALGLPTLRYAEPLDAEHFLNPLSVEFEGASAEEAAALVATLRERLHDPRYCYDHEWRDGDFVVADNHALIHGRKAFTRETSRHLQRIQVI